MNSSMSRQIRKYPIAPKSENRGYSEKFFWILPNNGIMSLPIIFLISHDILRFMINY